MNDKEKRLSLQAMLVGILGSNHVYFQPPSTVKMAYPAIVYSRQSSDIVHANDNNYLSSIMYEIIVIDRNPDSEIVEKMSMVKGIRHTRHYTVDNLHHDIFTLYV